MKRAAKEAKKAARKADKEEAAKKEADIQKALEAERERIKDSVLKNTVYRVSVSDSQIIQRLEIFYIILKLFFSKL